MSFANLNFLDYRLHGAFWFLSLSESSRSLWLHKYNEYSMSERGMKQLVEHKNKHGMWTLCAAAIGFSNSIKLKTLCKYGWSDSMESIDFFIFKFEARWLLVSANNPDMRWFFVSHPKCSVFFAVLSLLLKNVWSTDARRKSSNIYIQQRRSDKAGDTFCFVFFLYSWNLRAVFIKDRMLRSCEGIAMYLLHASYFELLNKPINYIFSRSVLALTEF